MPLLRSTLKSRQAKHHHTRRRQLSVQPLEARRVLAASLGWDGPGLGSAELTYHIANSPDSLSQAETDAAIETALAAWSSVADITFTPTTQSSLRDSIDFSFASIDGVGGTLAQAYFPDDVNPARIAGDVQFDLSDAWEVGNSVGNRAFDLVYVAVHEIGHSLGLDHTTLFGSALAPFVSSSQSFTTLDAVDAAAIQELYAAVDGVTTTEDPADDMTVDETPANEIPTGDNDTDDTSDADDNPFPRWRWRRGGHWHRWGGRLDALAPENNYVNPTDVNGDGNTTALDALTIINQLSRSSTEGEDVDVAGLCDTNGDGSITALDALTVINAISINEGSSASINVVDDTETTEVIDVVDEIEDAIDDETMDEVDETGDVDDDATDVDETVDPVDETDVADESDETDDSDTTDETIDDGGMVDETDDETDYHGGRHHHSGIFHVGLFGKDAGSLIDRFDADADSALSEAEVSERMWAKLTDMEVDADADGLVTLAELEAAITAARQEAFNGKDTDADGLLFETEVNPRLWRKISSADTDADGGVSFDELDGFVPEQPTQRMGRGGHWHHDRASDEVFASIGRAWGFRSRHGRR